MPHGCDYSVRVEIDVEKHKGRGKQPRTGLRKFIVEYDDCGSPLRIKEIRVLEKPQSGVYHQSFWAPVHSLGSGDTLVKRIIAAAQAKQEAQNRAYDATP